MVNARLDHDALDALFLPFDRTNAPGYAVGIAAAGQPSYRRGFGMASIELPVALSPTMRMRIGSTTKHFTALAILLLAEDGRLSIDDSPRRHLHQLPEWAQAMTIRQLLAHTSGMRDSLDLILHSSGPGRSASPEFQLDYLAGLDSVNGPPGKGWNYNNGGYVIATAIIEALSGQTYAEFLRRRVFEPVGMVDTLVRPLDTDLIPNSATLHVPTPDGGYNRGVFGTAIGGEGGIVSTVDDMLRWLTHMRAPHVGSRKSWNELAKPLTTHGYGLGLFVNQRRGLTLWHHAGAVVGGSCQMVRVDEPALDIILISNGRPSLEGYGLVEEIIDRCLNRTVSPAGPVQPSPPVKGVFHSRATGRMLELVHSSAGQAVRMGAMTLPLVDEGDGTFRLDFAVFDTLLDIDSGDAAISLREFGVDDRLERVDPSQAGADGTLIGCYRNSAARIEVEIISDGGGLHMDVAGPLGEMTYRLQPAGTKLWMAIADGSLPMVASLEVEDDRLLLTTGRTVRLELMRTPQ